MSAEKMSPCCIGELLDQTVKCSHPTSFRRARNYSKEELHILCLRAGLHAEVDERPIRNVCLYHHNFYIRDFSSRQKKCALAAAKHPGRKRKETRPIPYKLYLLHKKYVRTEPYLVPGQLLCQFCRKEIENKIALKIKQRKEAREKAAADNIAPNLSFSSNTTTTEPSQPMHSKGGSSQVNLCFLNRRFFDNFLHCHVIVIFYQIFFSFLICILRLIMLIMIFPSPLHLMQFWIRSIQL